MLELQSYPLCLAPYPYNQVILNILPEILTVNLNVQKLIYYPSDSCKT